MYAVQSIQKITAMELPSLRPASVTPATSSDTVDARGVAIWRLRVGLKAGPGTVARPEAGNRGEGFASLFQAHAALLHQVCIDGSVFFCRQLPKAGLSESTQHIRLILDPSPSPNLRSFN